MSSAEEEERTRRPEAPADGKEVLRGNCAIADKKA